MISLRNDYIRIPDDIEFLLEICRDLIKKFKEENPNKDLPITIKQLIRLRNIEKIHIR